MTASRWMAKAGVHVTVFGTKLPTGELVAKDIHVEESHGKHAGAHH